MTRSSEIDHFAFRPELIVEVTVVCDRACLGCYAPNVIVKNDHDLTFKERPGFYLHQETLLTKLNKITSTINRPLSSLAFRGGEPTCHPQLPDLIKIGLQYTDQLFVESHGRWVLSTSPDTGIDIQQVLTALNQPNVVLKVSFDSMHKISNIELEEALDVFDRNGVKWLVAITESGEQQLAEQRARCSWVPDSRIVFQKKALSAFELYSPPFGVIRSGGEHANALSVRTNF